MQRGDAMGGARSPSGRSSPTRPPSSSSSTPAFFIVQGADPNAKPPNILAPVFTVHDGLLHSPPKDKSPPGRKKAKDAKARAATNQPAELQPQQQIAQTLKEENEDDVAREDDGPNQRPQTPTTVTPARSKAMALTLLNRSGSAPDLPLRTTAATNVYSSSKKRIQLAASQRAHGAGPHLTALQRSRLTPLPINIRTGTLHRESLGDLSSPALVLPETAAQQRETHQLVSINEQNEVVIASLQKRIVQMEKELAQHARTKHSLERHVANLTADRQALAIDKTTLQKKVDELEKTKLMQQHAFEKLSDRYALACGNMHKLSEQHQSPHPENHAASVQVVLHQLSKENQEYARKISVLEARHFDDKVIIANQEKKIKRMKAEIEALQHMNDAANGQEDSDTGTVRQVTVDAAGAKPTTPADALNGSSVAPLPMPVNAASPGGGGASHLVSAEKYQYIDPNILKILEKVDSQFSITNAINLSTALKKWLNHCTHIVCSVSYSAVLVNLLRRTCDLLHCQHAALFQVNHGSKRLISRYSESGDVMWELPLDKGIVGFAARQNQLVNVRKAYDDARFYSSMDSITNTKSREVLCIPIADELMPAQPTSVVAVLQVWNTLHQKPFSTNDQILASFQAIQAGIVLQQTRVVENMQRANSKLLQLVQMPRRVLRKALRAVSEPGTCVRIDYLVATAQRQLADIVDTNKLKLFVLDDKIMQTWHVGAETDEHGRLMLFRKYARVSSSLCSLVLNSSTNCTILTDPVSEACYNETVDLRSGSGGVFLAPIPNSWGDLPLGMVQVARSMTTTALMTTSPTYALANPAPTKEKLAAQKADDEMTMHLITTFCQQLAGVLHYALGQQLYEACPPEVTKARLSYLTDRIEDLELEHLKELEALDAETTELERASANKSQFEQRIMKSMQRQRTGLTTPVTETSRPGTYDPARVPPPPAEDVPAAAKQQGGSDATETATSEQPEMPWSHMDQFHLELGAQHERERERSAGRLRGNAALIPHDSAYTIDLPSHSDDANGGDDH